MNTPKKSKICVVMPTYNNAGTVLYVVQRVLAVKKDVIVVMDGCTDDTEKVLKEVADQITIVKYKRNRGKGHALKKGFKKARELGYKYAITIDADGQHYPEDIPLFIKAEKENLGAMIIGSRDLKKENMPEKNTFANKFSNFWFRVQTGINLPDTQTGFRLYPLKKLPNLWLLTSRYESELELLVFSAWKDVKLVPIDINVFYPDEEQRVTHFRPFWDFFRISVLNTFLTIIAICYYWPKRFIKAVIRIYRKLKPAKHD